MDNIKVSVILPVYNGEKYIKKCMESLISQTLKEIEIICVDDGSVDGTLEALKEYDEFRQCYGYYTGKCRCRSCQK